MRFIWVWACVCALPAIADVESILKPLSDRNREAIVLKNDNFVEAGGQAVLQLGFVKGEKAGVWVKVPATINEFKVDYFRVLVGGRGRHQIFFEMGIAENYGVVIPKEIVNAATITPGPYWNDIPAMGASNNLSCAKGGQLIGGAIEFTNDGAPSVYRDVDGLTVPQANLLFAIPGGWNFSSVFGLTGDWILRVVGHVAKPGDC